MTHSARTLALALLLVGPAACTHVPAWDRGKLAHPTMTSVGTPSVAEEHLYSVQEGAWGGTAGTQSGCGCN